MTPTAEPRWSLDRPNSYIGRTVPRPNLSRLVQGRAAFVDDVRLPRMAHVAFVRSPHAHARIRAIDGAAARRLPGVVAVVTGAELARHCAPWVGVLTHLEGMRSPPQHAMAVDRACWQGEPVAAVVADTREQAEDAAERVDVDWERLPAATDAETALDRDAPVIHADLGDNLCWQRRFDAGDVDAACAEADAVVEETFVIGRHTGVTLEPRARRPTRSFIAWRGAWRTRSPAGRERAAMKSPGGKRIDPSNTLRDCLEISKRS